MMLRYRCLHKKPCGSERGRRVSICVCVGKICLCVQVRVHALGRCVLTEVTVFSLHIFTHNHITPTLKTDTYKCNALAHTLTLFLSLYFRFGSWNYCNSDSPNTILNNLLLCGCVCVCVHSCVSVKTFMHACVCIVLLNRYCFPLRFWSGNLATGEVRRS